MKKYKRVLILLGVLAVVCAATFALGFFQERQEAIEAKAALILELSGEDITEISWETEEGGLSFRRNDEGNWLYTEDEAFPVSEDAINEILAHFEAFSADFTITDVSDYSMYGLDDPVGYVTVTTAEESYTLELGDFSKMDQQRYVNLGDGKVYLVEDDPADFLKTELSEMILHDDTPVISELVSIQLSGLENYTIVYDGSGTGSYDADDVYFTDNGRVLDPSAVKTYLNNISYLTLTDYVTYNATQEELEACGLTDPELTVTVTYTETDTEGNAQEKTCVLYISRDPEELQAAQEAEAAGETPDAVTKYVRVGQSQIVYAMTDSNYETLTAASYDDLRHTEVFWADFDSVTKLEITLEDTLHTLTLGEDTEGNAVWYYGDTEISVSELKSALNALSADSFTGDAPGEKEELRLTVYLDNENFPQVELVLYRYDGSLCLAQVDGESVCYVSRSYVMTLVEAVNAIVLN